MEVYMKQWQIQSRNNQSNDDHIIITKQNKTNKQTNKQKQSKSFIKWEIVEWIWDEVWISSKETNNYNVCEYEYKYKKEW